MCVKDVGTRKGVCKMRSLLVEKLYIIFLYLPCWLTGHNWQGLPPSVGGGWECSKCDKKRDRGNPDGYIYGGKK